MSVRCPICDTDNLPTFLSRRDLAEEMAMREPFFEERMEKLDERRKIDRVIVSHGAEGELRICRACGVIVRDEVESPDFESEPYPDDVMERMLRAHIDAYRAKEVRYRDLLPRGAKVIEVGSYVGGFLHVAGEWGWNASGVDVGRDTSHFTKSRGYDTCDDSLAACSFDNAHADGAFIFNAFEQLDPKPVLAEAHRILRDDGVLVLRVPNALFYAACQSLMRRPVDASDPILIALGHTNLIGWPHLYGYSRESLDRIARDCGFRAVTAFGDRHIIPQRDRFTQRGNAESNAIERAQAMLDDAFASLAPDAIISPWIEAVYRSTISNV